VALFINPLLLFIAIFVFLGAEGEAQSVQFTSRLRGVTVQQAMLTRYRALSAHDLLNRAVSELLAGSQQEFPVVRGEEVVGILAPNDLVKALAERGPGGTVGEAMRSDCRTVNENDPLEDCYELLRQNGCATLPVLREGRLTGLLTLENLTEWMMIHSVLQPPLRTSEARA
jgi:predicted transcriptional regulator